MTHYFDVTNDSNIQLYICVSVPHILRFRMVMTWLDISYIVR